MCQRVIVREGVNQSTGRLDCCLRFEELDREFSVGVVTADGRHLLIDSGPLPEAVAASAAIPYVFQAVDVPGRSCWALEV